MQKGNCTVGVCSIIAFLIRFKMSWKCGKGIAVANAIPMIKEIADDIADSNDNEGVAKFLVKEA